MSELPLPASCLVAAMPRGRFAPKHVRPKHGAADSALPSALGFALPDRFDGTYRLP